MSERRFREVDPLDMLIYRVQQLEEDRKEIEGSIKILGERINNLTLAIVGFALTLAVFGLGIAATLLAGH